MTFDLQAFALVAGVVSAIVAIVRFGTDVCFPRLRERRERQRGAQLAQELREGLESLQKILDKSETLQLEEEAKYFQLIDIKGQTEALNQKTAEADLFIYGRNRTAKASPPKANSQRLARGLIGQLPPELQQFADELKSDEEEGRRDGSWREPKETAGLILLVIRSRFWKIRVERRRPLD